MYYSNKSNYARGPVQPFSGSLVVIIRGIVSFALCHAQEANVYYDDMVVEMMVRMVSRWIFYSNLNILNE